MINLTSLPVIDHHCHPYEPEKAILEPEFLAREFFHGMGDIPDPKVLQARHWGASDELRYHFPHMGVVYTMVQQLSRVLDCPAELEAVTQARNRIASENFGAYARLLYEDAGIVGTVLDSGLPNNDPLLNLMPGPKLRLFQFQTKH